MPGSVGVACHASRSIRYSSSDENGSVELTFATPGAVCVMRSCVTAAERNRGWRGAGQRPPALAVLVGLGDRELPVLIANRGDDGAVVAHERQDAVDVLEHPPSELFVVVGGVRRDRRVAAELGVVRAERVFDLADVHCGLPFP